MPAKKRPRSKPEEVAPRNGRIPHIGAHEIPSKQEVIDLMKAVSFGLGVEAASAYANVPSAFVRNWVARGRAQELEPFDPSKYSDEEVRETHIEYHKAVTIPCYSLWMLWRKMRAEFLMKCVSKVKSSKDWRAHAWLLERMEPSLFMRVGAPAAIKRELLPYEKEVEAAVVDDPDIDKDVVQILLPSNSR